MEAPVQTPGKLDDAQPLTPMQSATIRAGLYGIASSVIGLIALYTGKAIDLAFVNQTIDLLLPIIVYTPVIYYYYRAIKCRINATQIIKKE